MTTEDPGRTNPEYVYGPDQGDTQGAEEVTGPPEVAEILTKAEQKNAFGGLVVGLIIIVLGVLLLLLGISGMVDFEIANGETKAKLSTGAVGAVVALIGLAVIYFTRMRVVIKK